MVHNQNTKIKVVMIIATYYPVWGGAQRQLKQIGEFLVDNGVEFFILTRRLRGTKKFEIIDGVSVYRIFVTNRSKIIDSILYTFLSLIWLLLNKSKFDILHCYQTYSPTTIGVFIKKILKKKRVFVKVTSSNEYGETNEIKRLPFFKLRIHILECVDKFLVVNRQIIKELNSLGIPLNKIEYIPNGVKIPRDDCLTEGYKQQLRNRLDLNFKKIAIFTGRITEEKNLDTLLNSWKIIVQDHPESHLIILGEGCKERNSQGKIANLRVKLNMENSVHLLGKVDNVFDYLLASDIFVLPSISEGLSNSLLEAMSAGLGVIVGDNDGNRQLINDGENGILVNPRDSNNIYHALCKMIENEDFSKLLGRNARQTVINNFSIEDIALKYINQYRACLEKER